MKRSDWRSKLDQWALNYLEAHRQAVEARRQEPDDLKWNERLSEIADQYPEFEVLRTVELLPAFLDGLLENEVWKASDFASNLKPGKHEMSAGHARLLKVAQAVTLALQDPGARIAAGFAVGAAALFVGSIFDDLKKKHYGDKGPKEAQDFQWLLGSTIEILGQMLKSGKPPEIKGKLNVELISLIRVLREHQTKRLTYRELLEALRYGGVHVSDEESLRNFEWRARKNGWIVTKPVTR